MHTGKIIGCNFPRRSFPVLSSSELLHFTDAPPYVNLKAGRPDWDGEFKSLAASYGQEEIGCIFCGAPAIASALKEACEVAERAYKQAKLAALAEAEDDAEAAVSRWHLAEAQQAQGVGVGVASRTDRKSVV